jgi:hypothetical protein
MRNEKIERKTERKRKEERPSRVTDVYNSKPSTGLTSLTPPFTKDISLVNRKPAAKKSRGKCQMLSCNFPDQHRVKRYTSIGHFPRET